MDRWVNCIVSDPHASRRVRCAMCDKPNCYACAHTHTQPPSPRGDHDARCRRGSEEADKRAHNVELVWRSLILRHLCRSLDELLEKELHTMLRLFYVMEYIHDPTVRSMQCHRHTSPFPIKTAPSSARQTVRMVLHEALLVGVCVDASTEDVAFVTQDLDNGTAQRYEGEFMNHCPNTLAFSSLSFAAAAAAAAAVDTGEAVVPPEKSHGGDMAQRRHSVPILTFSQYWTVFANLATLFESHTNVVIELIRTIRTIYSILSDAGEAHSTRVSDVDSASIVSAPDATATEAAALSSASPGTAHRVTSTAPPSHSAAVTPTLSAQRTHSLAILTAASPQHAPAAPPSTSKVAATASNGLVTKDAADAEAPMEVLPCNVVVSRNALRGGAPDTDGYAVAKDKTATCDEESKAHGTQTSYQTESYAHRTLSEHTCDGGTKGEGRKSTPGNFAHTWHRTQVWRAVTAAVDFFNSTVMQHFMAEHMMYTLRYSAGIVPTLLELAQLWHRRAGVCIGLAAGSTAPSSSTGSDGVASIEGGVGNTLSAQDRQRLSEYDAFVELFAAALGRGVEGGMPQDEKDEETMTMRWGGLPESAAVSSSWMRKPPAHPCTGSVAAVGSFVSAAAAPSCHVGMNGTQWYSGGSHRGWQRVTDATRRCAAHRRAFESLFVLLAAPLPSLVRCSHVAHVIDHVCTAMPPHCASKTTKYSSRNRDNSVDVGAVYDEHVVLGSAGRNVCERGASECTDHPSRSVHARDALGIGGNVMNTARTHRTAHNTTQLARAMGLQRVLTGLQANFVRRAREQAIEVKQRVCEAVAMADVAALATRMHSGKESDKHGIAGVNSKSREATEADKMLLTSNLSPEHRAWVLASKARITRELQQSTPTRLLLHYARVMCHYTVRQEREERWLFLFSDCLCLVKELGRGQFRTCVALSLGTIAVYSVADSAAHDMLNCFEVHEPDTFVMIFYTDSPEEKQRWVDWLHFAVRRHGRATDDKKSKHHTNSPSTRTRAGARATRLLPTASVSPRSHLQDGNSADMLLLPAVASASAARHAPTHHSHTRPMGDELFRRIASALDSNPVDGDAVWSTNSRLTRQRAYDVRLQSCRMQSLQTADEQVRSRAKMRVKRGDEQDDAHTKRPAQEVQGEPSVKHSHTPHNTHDKSHEQQQQQQQQQHQQHVEESLAGDYVNACDVVIGDDDDDGLGEKPAEMTDTTPHVEERAESKQGSLVAVQPAVVTVSGDSTTITHAPAPLVSAQDTEAAHIPLLPSPPPPFPPALLSPAERRISTPICPQRRRELAHGRVGGKGYGAWRRQAQCRQGSVHRDTSMCSSDSDESRNTCDGMREHRRTMRDDSSMDDAFMGNKNSGAMRHDSDDNNNSCSDVCGDASANTNRVSNSSFAAKRSRKSVTRLLSRTRSFSAISRSAMASVQLHDAAAATAAAASVSEEHRSNDKEARNRDASVADPRLGFDAGTEVAAEGLSGDSATAAARLYLAGDHVTPPRRPALEQYEALSELPNESGVHDG